MSDISEAISALSGAVIDGRIKPTEGLPEELFLLVSSLVPIVNIDLFITNEKHELLLSWRADLHHRKGWHIPGGCVRLKESLTERIERTSITELGGLVKYDPVPLLVREGINNSYRIGLENQLERAHGISFLYQCQLPEEYEMPNESNGIQFRWFNSYPTDLLAVHKELYGDYIRKWFRD